MNLVKVASFLDFFSSPGYFRTVLFQLGFSHFFKLLAFQCALKNAINIFYSIYS
jgi:hypothetical protein